MTLTRKTQILSGKETVGRDALVPGEHVDVHGSRLPGGGMAAKEVVVERRPEAPATHHEP